MPFQLSPGVAVVEKDFSSIVPAVSSSAGAYCGPFAWGPIEDPVRVSSETDLVARFGQPQTENYQSFFISANFLSYTNNLLVTRTDAPGLRNAVSKKTSGVTAAGIVFNTGSGYVLDDNPTVVFDAPKDENGVVIPGGIAATGEVTYSSNVVDGITNLTLTGISITNPGFGYIDNPTVVISEPANVDGVQATATVTLNLSAIKIKNVGHYLDSYSAGISGVGMFASKFAGTKGNGIRVIVIDAGNWASTPDNVTRLFPGKPDTSDFAAKQQNPISNDELHLAVFDTPTGTFSGVANSLLEKYTFLSKLTDARRADGSNNYYKSVINSQSKYIWWMDHASSDQYSEAPSPFIVDNIIGANATLSTDSIQINLTDGINDTNYDSLQEFYTWYLTAVDKTARQIKVTGATKITNNGVFNIRSITRNTTTGLGPDAVENFIFLLNNSGVTGISSGIAANESALKVTSISKGRWGYDSLTIKNDSDDAVYSLKVLNGPIESVLSDGADDFKSTPGNIVSAYTVLTNPEQYDVSLIPIGNVDAVTANQIVSLFDGSDPGSRRDSIVFISPNDNGEPITNASSAVAAIIKYRNDSNINSSYAVMDSGWKYQYDRYNDMYRWVPLNGDIAGLCARTDYTADPWYSPGGFNRGQIKNVVKLGFNPGQTDRDTLYAAGVNPVVSFPGQGIILYGDKTMLTKPSAFDRINVRRLFIVLEKSIAVAAKYQMFEFNDSFSRAQFKNLVEPYLRDVQGRRGVTDFRVKCDESNNTGEIIDRNEFVADIFIKPARSINYITLNFIAARTSVSFEEIGA